MNKFRSLSSTSPPGSLCSKRLKSNPCCADSAAHGSVTPSSTLPMVLSSARATRPITLWKRCQAFQRTAVLSLQLEPEDALQGSLATILVPPRSCIASLVATCGLPTCSGFESTWAILLGEPCTCELGRYQLQLPTQHPATAMGLGCSNNNNRQAHKGNKKCVVR